MNWLFYALLAPALYAITTFIDKFIVETKVQKVIIMPIYMGISALIIGMILFIYNNSPFLSITNTVLIMTIGLINLLAIKTFYKALLIEETSRINILFLLTPVLIIILSYLFLNERVSDQQIFGFILIISASIIISFNKDIKKISLSSALPLVLFNDLLFAIAAVMAKFILGSVPFLTVLIYESFGMGLGAVILLLTSKNAQKMFVQIDKKLQFKYKILIFFNESIYATAKGITFLAFSLGSVSLVSVLEGTQAFYAIGYGLILGYYFPKIFKETTSKYDITKKIFAAGLAVIGIYFIS